MLGMEVTTHRYGSGNVMNVQHDQLHEVLLQLGRGDLATVSHRKTTMQRKMDMTFRSLETAVRELGSMRTTALRFKLVSVSGEQTDDRRAVLNQRIVTY
jgi:hypothetical protein